MKANAAVLVAALVLLAVVAPTCGQVISGAFLTEADLRMQTLSLTLQNYLNLSYTVGDWFAGLNAALTSRNFLESLTVMSGLDLGAMEAAGGMCFMRAAIPGLGEFPLGYAYSWADIHLNFGGTRITIAADNSVFPLGRLPFPEDWPCAGREPFTALALVVQQAPFSAAVRLGQCCDDYSGFLDFRGGVSDLAFCCGTLDGELYVTCQGFEHLCLSVDDIAVASLPFLSLTADICFEVESKTLTLSPKFDFGADVCFDIYVSAGTGGGSPPQPLPRRTRGGRPRSGPLSIGDIAISGMGVECQIGEVSFAGLSYWGTGTKPGILEGTTYWEAYQIKTADDACCGDFAFDLSVFFDKQSELLFDWAELRAEFTLALGAGFSFGFSMAADDSGLLGMGLSFQVTF